MALPANVVHHPQSSGPAWHALRKGRIGASSMGKCIGVSEYVDPYSEFGHILRKADGRSLPGEFDYTNESIQHGITAEPLICDLFARITGLDLKPGGIYTSTDGFCASPDRLVYHYDILVATLEVKAPRSLYNTSVLPLEHLIQAQAQAQMAGLKRAYYAYAQLPVGGPYPAELPLDTPMQIWAIDWPFDWMTNYVWPRLFQFQEKLSHPETWPTYINGRANRVPRVSLWTSDLPRSGINKTLVYTTQPYGRMPLRQFRI